MVGVVAFPLGAQALDGDGSLLPRVTEQFLKESELFLDLGIFRLQLQRLLRQSRLSAPSDAEVALELRGLGTEFPVLILEVGDLALQLGLLLRHLAAIEPAQKLPEVETPPPHAHDKDKKREQRGNLPTPRQVRAHRHSRSADTESLAQPAP